MQSTDTMERWLALAVDVHIGLLAAADESQEMARGVTNWSPEAVAVRLLLRSCRSLEGVILLCRHRLVVEARTLARSILENSFGATALGTEESAQKYLQMLMDDAEKSRRNQGNFILDELPFASGDRAQLKEVTDAIDKRLALLSPKHVAELGPMLPQYIVYQRLSNDSAHATATALEHHVDRYAEEAWTYRFEPGTDDEISATFRHGLLAALAVGLAVTKLVNANIAFTNLYSLSERWDGMPPTQMI